MGEAVTNQSSSARVLGRPPSLLGPWLATGLGLLALQVAPEASVVDPAYAATPSLHVGLAAPHVGAGLANLTASQQLFVAAPPTPVASATSALSAMQLNPRLELASSALPSAVDRLFQVTGTPVRPLPRTTDATTIPNQSGKSMNERWADLRHCEATSDYEAINNSGKYRGAYQFDLPTWESVGGTGDPAVATEIEQDKRARILFERRGPAPWPECGSLLE